MNTTDEEVVISGISGRFPESENFDEFAINLFANKDLITEDERRWPRGLNSLPNRMGKLKNIDRFDASFFGLPETVANDADPQSRLLLETTAEAIFDAGVDLSKLRGTNTGVYIGFTTIGTAEGIPQTDDEVVNNAFLMMGTSRAIYANRINFIFDFRGPSNIMDTACASSMSAIYHAMNDIKSGACDQAVVGGVNLCLAPFSNYLMTAVGAVSVTGQSRVFDDKANGYVRSEACVTVFLQKKSSAKRVYATIINCRTNTDGFKKPGLFFPSSEMQSKLMARVCSEAGIDPLSIKYFEAHGTGTRAGDPQEVIAINNTYFNEKRTSPLLIGSVKSVVGHSEGASGLVSIAKVLISFEKQMIPANLNFDFPNELIKDLIPKKVRVITQNTPFPGGIVGLNSYGIGGVNVNLLLKPNEVINSKNCENKKDKIPRLICLFGRNSETINNLFEFVEKNPGKINEHFLYLMNNIIHYKPTIGSSGFPCRGYMIVKNYTNGSISSYSESELIKKVNLNFETKPLVFLFPGFGCQWSAMGKSLMAIETFSNTIDELANILTEFNVDLKKILTSDDDMAFKSCTSVFVAITAIQIALVNIMKTIDIRPDFILGHSFGEIACAYADGALTSREAILCSYWRGNCLENSSIIPGAMIAVQMSWAEAMKKCEGKKIIAACHNSDNSVTLSGPELEILQLQRDFEEENKFARRIRGVEFPFHTPYLKPVEITMLNKLNDVIKYPKKRTTKWLSTSLLGKRLFNNDLNFASSKYFVNNLLSPVYFHEAILKLPENCVIMEIGPHSLFESILKNKSGNSYISLMKRGDNGGNLIRLLSSVGELYLNGLSPKIENLYPKIELPVPRGTQSISSLIKWDHGKSYFVRKFPDYYNHVSSSNYIYNIKLGSSSRWNFLKDHVIDGTNLFPGTGYLMLAWQSLAANKNTPWKKLPVEFKDVRILSGTTLSNENPVKFIVNVDDSSGQFYVKVGFDIACTGNISVLREPILSLSCQYEKKLKNQNIELSLESKDIYKTLRAHGYDFGPKFTGVMKATRDFTCIELKWTGEWISFADSMLHVLPYIKGLKSRTILVPSFIESLKCDPRLLYSRVEEEMTENKVKTFTIFYDKNLDAVFSNCIEFQGFHSIPINRKDNLQGLCLEKYVFVANNEVNEDDSENGSNILDRDPCDAPLGNILKEFDFEIKKYLTDDKIENFEENNNSINILTDEISKSESKLSLNNSLKDIFNNNEMPDKKISFQQLVKIIKKKHSSLPLSDITGDFLADERLLRTQLDIVLENHYSNKFFIFEYNDGYSNCLYKFVKNWLRYSPLFEIPFEYKLTNFGEQSSDCDKEMNFEEIHISENNTNFLNNMRDYDIAIVNCFLYQPNYKEFVLKLSNIIKENGFILIIIQTSLTLQQRFLIKLKNLELPEPNNAEEIIRISPDVGFNVISTKRFSSSLTTVLLRKKYRIELNKSLIMKIRPENFDWVNDLQSKIKELEEEKNDRKIWLIGNEPEIGIIGFINCLRKELKSDRIRCIFDMERSLPEDLTELKKKINKISDSNLVFNVLRDGKLGTFRHLTLEKNLMTPLIEAKNLYLKILKRGDLNTLRWFEIPNEDYLETKNKELNKRIPVKVYYATINDTDIDKIYNRSSIDPKFLKHEILIGKEFSGKIKHSDKRVMGIKFSGAVSTDLFTHEDLLFEIPDNWSLIESATVPFNYFICYYSLYLKGNLRENESVFLRIKNFCLSQAAISICLSRKCQIFVTVMNSCQEKILLDKFGFNSGLIFIRENISTKNQILNLTNGKGVDLILSCDEEYFDDCMHCLKNCGTYLELKKQNILNNQMLPSIEFRRNISFHSIDIDYILCHFQYGIKPNPIWERQIKEVKDHFEKGLKNGEIKPFPQRIFKKDRFREAVQVDAFDPNLDLKNIIEIQEEKDDISKSIQIKAAGRFSFNPCKTYIITGGLGGFGFELTKWLFERGARKIILTSRTGIKNNIQEYFIDYFNAKEGHVEVSNLDITNEKQAINLIERAQKFGQIGGIFHLALVMKDGFFENQNSKQFHDVHMAKFNGLKNLDNITRSRNINLDLFVAFSSISCGRGNPGQSNYGFSNSSVERLCEMRRKDGLHGMAIQWGPIDDVGVLIEKSDKINEDLKHKGLIPQRVPTCFAVLDYVLNLPHAVVSSFTRGESVTKKSNNEESLLEQLSIYLGLDYKKLSDLATLEDIGVDSLMSLEVQKRLEREFEKSIPLTSIKKITVGQLKAVNKSDKTDFLKILKL